MKNVSLRKIVFAALMAALTTVATMIIRIPTPLSSPVWMWASPWVLWVLTPPLRPPTSS